MKSLLLFSYIFFSILGLSQNGIGGGNYPKIADCGIKSISKFRISYLDSNKTDTLLEYKQDYDNKGNLIEETFKGVYGGNSTYSYTYNRKGFLTDIDTSGLFGYSYGSGGPDTAYYSISEAWIIVDNIELIKKRSTISDNGMLLRESEFYYTNIGKLVKEEWMSVDKKYRSSHFYTIDYLYAECGLLKEKRYSLNEEGIYAKELYIFTK
jgi:hypothetical protein